jgi:hypothetical protein
MTACTAQHINVVYFLLYKGVDIETKSIGGWNAHNWANGKIRGILVAETLRRRQVREAFLMGLHPRLGDESSIRDLCSELAKIILDNLRQQQER